MLRYAFYPCPFGVLKIGCTENGVSFLKLIDRPDGPNEPTLLSEQANCELQAYFAGERTSFSLPLCPDGTPFQQKVWQALLTIPYGQTASYKQIAEQIDHPRAFRAVGMANRANPLWILIPCHRVVGADGSLTGYAGGLKLKRALLELERRAASRA